LEHIGEPLPNVGQIELIVDGNGDPLCIIELTEVESKPFNAVDEQFAFEYGEGNRTLTFWLDDNCDFLSRWCCEIGREPSQTIPLAFQRFRVVYPKNDMYVARCKELRSIVHCPRPLSRLKSES
jgi:uncharacterized protein YhfF